MILACPMSFQTLSFSSLFYITDIPTCHIPYSSQSQQFLTANSCISPRLMLSLVAWHPLVSLCSRSAACLVSYRTQCPLPVLPDVLCRTVIQGILLRYYTVLKPAITSSASSLTPGCHLSCTRISFAFKMSTPSPRQASGFSLCPSLRHGTWSHLAVATSQGDVNPSTHRPVLLTGNSQAWVCCTNPLPTRQSQPAHHTEMPVGSSRSCPAILPLMWPGLCLTVRQEILMQTSFLSDSRKMNRVVFLHSYNGSNGKKGRTSTAGGVCRACWVGIRGPLGVPHI